MHVGRMARQEVAEGGVTFGQPRPAVQQPAGFQERSEVDVDPDGTGLVKQFAPGAEYRRRARIAEELQVGDPGYAETQPGSGRLTG
jgi:hypothetical protein